MARSQCLLVFFFFLSFFFSFRLDAFCKAYEMFVYPMSLDLRSAIASLLQLLVSSLILYIFNRSMTSVCSDAKIRCEK